MNRTVTDPAAVTDLIELADVQARLGALATGKDALLPRWISEVSSAAATEMRRPLARQAYTELLPGLDKLFLQLSAWPIDPDQVTVKVNGVAVTDFVVYDWESGILFREAGWPEGEDLDVEVAYFGGWLLPSVVKAWVANNGYQVGDWVRAAAGVTRFLFECTVAGTSDPANEPDWSSAAAGGDTILDPAAGGEVTWTARVAVELPEELVSLAFAGVHGLLYANSRPPGVTSMKGGQAAESYSPEAVASAGVPEHVRRGFRRWRSPGA